MESSFFIKSGKTGLVFLLCLCLTACAFRSPFPDSLSEELQSAESLMYTRPDSALRLLERMPSPSDKCQHATWALLLTQARYRCYVEQSDSLLDIASDYFMEGDNAQRKALTLYCRAGLCEEEHDLTAALDFYLQAAAEVDQTDDSRLGYFINTSLTDLYAYRALNNYAEHTAQKAAIYAERSGQKKYMVRAVINLAHVYSLQEDYKKAIEAYEDAIGWSKQSGYETGLLIGLNDLGGLYAHLKEYEKAIPLLKEGIALEAVQSHSGKQLYLNLASIYSETCQADSAYFYAEKALGSDNVYTLRSVYHILYDLSRKEGNYKEALGYSDKQRDLNDSIQKQERSRTFIEMQEKYDKQQLIIEKNELRIEKKNTVLAIVTISLLLLLATGTVAFRNQRKLIRKESIIQDQKKALRLLNQRIKENEALNERCQKAIENLSMQMKIAEDSQKEYVEQIKAFSRLQQQNEDLRKENGRLQSDIGNYLISLDRLEKELKCRHKSFEEIERLRNRERCLCSLLVERNEILGKLKNRSKQLGNLQFEEVKKQIDVIYDRYTERLQEIIPSLTEQDLQICCLMKLRIPHQNIADILCISSSSVSKRKQRLKERIIQATGIWTEGQTLEEWLLGV